MLPRRCLIRKSDPTILLNVTLRQTFSLPGNKTACALRVTRLWHRCLPDKCPQAWRTCTQPCNYAMGSNNLLFESSEGGIGVTELAAAGALRWMHYTALRAPSALLLLLPCLYLRQRNMQHAGCRCKVRRVDRGNVFDFGVPSWKSLLIPCGTERQIGIGASNP